MVGKAHIPNREERKLHTKSLNRCAICNTELVDPTNENSTCIGENAHIYGEKPGAARYDESQDEAFVNSEKNLIYVCCNCHRRIDSIEERDHYTVEMLFDLKKKHENNNHTISTPQNTNAFLSNLHQDDIMNDITLLRQIKPIAQKLLNLINNNDFCSPFPFAIELFDSYILTISDMFFSSPELQNIVSDSISKTSDLQEMIIYYSKAIGNNMAVMKRIGACGETTDESFEIVKNKMSKARKETYQVIKLLLNQEDVLIKQLRI